MKKFRVSFQETLERIIEIEAENEDKAQEIANEMYRNEEVVLDWQDFIDKDIEVLEEVKEDE